ncbi:uncharacterized protein LOC127094081 [Lathyrus oleraceus]|uniref:uncharacterized protein LOC127094081 n=1 Tax=Pisum sativum TaxID=3888 RepID=UPI0021D2E2F6|nr:uncharacterized protein LOC127094081 [Pisum sativum]
MRKRPIGCKWCKKKPGVTEKEEEKFKTHLVAKEYSRWKGIDYDEIFSLVVRHTSIIEVLSLVASKNMHLEHMDVKTTFLHANIEEKIYMERPEGFNDTGHGRLVCKLKRSLYGLKISPRKCMKQGIPSVLGYIDYDYAGDLDDRRSTISIKYTTHTAIVSLSTQDGDLLNTFYVFESATSPSSMSEEPQETPIKLFKRLVESYDDPNVNSPASLEELLVSNFSELFQQLKSKMADLNLLEVVCDNPPIFSELQELMSKLSQP